MSSVLSFAPKLNPHFDLGHRCVISRPTNYRRTHTCQCTGKNPLSSSSSSSSSSTSSSSSSSSTTTQQENSESDKNLFLKVAWYSSELLGIAASFLRKPSNGETQEMELVRDGSTVMMDRAQVVESIKEDFRRAYFVTGNLTLNAYEEECEFADPAGSFKGLGRFKRNCSNFGSLIEKSNMKLMKWEDFEVKGIGHWRFSCILSFPWKPILSATGYTEYYFDPQTGRVCRHVEHWNVPKMALFKQILRPSSRGWWGKKTSV